MTNLADDSDAPTSGDFAGGDLPPGHPAGADTTVSAGEALSGREQRSDAVVQADRTLAEPEPRPAPPEQSDED